jgi:hypothetical protein
VTCDHGVLLSVSAPHGANRMVSKIIHLNIIFVNSSARLPARLTIALCYAYVYTETQYE